MEEGIDRHPFSSVIKSIDPCDQILSDKSLTEALPLTQSIGELALMVRKLNERIERLIEDNAALQGSTERAWNEVKSVNVERDKMAQHIEKLTAYSGNLETEVEKLGRERETAIGNMRELSSQLNTSQERVKELTSLSEKYREERNGAVEGAAGVESQLSRAIKVIEHLCGYIAQRQRRESDLEKRTAFLQEQLHKVVGERDGRLVELEEARRASKEGCQSITAPRREEQRLFAKG